MAGKNADQPAGFWGKAWKKGLERGEVDRCRIAMDRLRARSNGTFASTALPRRVLPFRNLPSVQTEQGSPMNGRDFCIKDFLVWRGLVSGLIRSAVPSRPQGRGRNRDPAPSG